MLKLHINNCPTRCNTKQSIYYSASSVYMFRVSTTPIIRSTQNRNYNLRYWSYFLCSYLPPTWQRQNSLFIILKVHSTCFGCQPHSSSGVHKTVNYSLQYWSYFLCSYVPPTWLKRFPGGCSYSFGKVTPSPARAHDSPPA